MSIIDTKISRRSALKGLGAAAAAGLVAQPLSALAQGVAAPAVRRKVDISYWTWADNPGHQQRIMDAVAAFNKDNGFITVTADATGVTLDVRQKMITAFASGAGPDVGGVVQTNAQEYYDIGMLEPIDPFFTAWDESADYIPSVVEAMRGQPGQPVLFLPVAILPYVLYYRADWFDEAGLKPPATYEEFISSAKAITKAPDRYGYALRGASYYAVQPIEPIHASAGVQFVDANGNVDFDSKEAVAVTERWVGMFTKDKSAQPSAVSDGYPQLFALMEQGKGGMWIYGTHSSPQLTAALGDRIQAVAIPPVAGGQPRTLANPEGNFILSSSKEKEAGFEFLQYLSKGEPAMSLGPARGLMPVRKSLNELPEIQNNRFFKVAVGESDNWWRPPYQWKNWASYQEKIPPYWQQALREEISVQEFHDHAARFLRGEG